MAGDGVLFIGKGIGIKAPPKALAPVIPVIFVPGVLGSNLRIATRFIPKVQEIFMKEGRTEEFKGESWLPPTVTDSPMKAAGHVWEELRNRDSDAVKLAKRWESYGPKIRQALMSPVMTEVDPNGVIPENLSGLSSAPGQNGPAEARRRGWGSVHWESYGSFLVAMEMSLNRGHSRLGLERLVEWVDFGRYQSLAERHFPEAVLPTDADLKHAAPFLFPVFAFGYNFTRSNAESALELLKALEKWIGEYQQAGHDCKQAILVTHSMGGLVARAASKLDSKGLILGVIHGVMPATGAPVLYRRVVAGWEAEKGRVVLPEANGTEGHLFIWETPGKANRWDLPQIRIELATGSGQTDSSLSDADALALWDLLLGSWRWRPTQPATPAR